MINSTLTSRSYKLHKFVIYTATSSLFVLPLASCSTGRVEQAVQPIQLVVSVYDQEFIAKTLMELTNLEIDAYYAYAKISKEIKNKEFKKFCDSIQSEHKDRIVALSKILVDINIIPPLFVQEFKGFTTPGYTLIQGAKTQHRALEAIYTNEIISNKLYVKALEVYMPESIKEVILKHALEEKLLLNKVAEKLEGIKRG